MKIPRPKKLHLVFSFCLVLFAGVNCSAQKADSLTYLKGQQYFWVEGNLGGGTYLVTAGAEAGVLLNNQFILDAKVSGNVNVFSGNDNREADEYALMLGVKLTRKRYCNFFLLAGVSKVDLKTRGGALYISSSYYGYDVRADDRTASQFGVPINLKMMLSPVNFMAFDFGASANINAKRSFFALTFGIAFGKIRSGQAAVPPGRSMY